MDVLKTLPSFYRAGYGLIRLLFVGVFRNDSETRETGTGKGETRGNGKDDVRTVGALRLCWEGKWLFLQRFCWQSLRRGSDIVTGGFLMLHLRSVVCAFL